MINFCDLSDYTYKIYLTIVHKPYDADTFFPVINYDEWEKAYIQENNYDEKSNLNYSYYILKRKANI